MSSTSPIGNRGSVPEATSVLVFTIVAGLLWYAFARTGGDVAAAAGGAIYPLDVNSAGDDQAGSGSSGVAGSRP